MHNLAKVLVNMIQPDGSIASRDHAKQRDGVQPTGADVTVGARLAAFKTARKRSTLVQVDNVVCPYCDGHRVLAIDPDWIVPVDQGGQGGIPRGIDISPYVRMRGAYIGPGANVDNLQFVYCSCHAGKVKRTDAKGQSTIEEIVPIFDDWFGCSVWDTEYGHKLVEYRQNRNQKRPKMNLQEFIADCRKTGFKTPFAPDSATPNQVTDFEPEDRELTEDEAWEALEKLIPDPPENHFEYQEHDDELPPF